jgi:uncharacterized membrane protein
MPKDTASGLLKLVLLLAVFNTAYLSWRYLALESGFAARGSGFCSLTEFVDCDEVLSTPQARAFYVPNALLGFGFFFGCFLWLLAGFRFFPDSRRTILLILGFWLLIASGLTLYFFWLLVRLPNLCPLCPWNHLLTYCALLLTVSAYRKTPENTESMTVSSIAALAAVCIGQFAAWLFLWQFLR